jgi:predicted lipase
MAFMASAMLRMNCDLFIAWVSCCTSASSSTEYLFETRSSGKASSKVNKCEAILDQIGVLFEEYPAYRLYVTGHSLGMALAILFGAEAAASKDPRIPKPVTIMGIASPKIGNRAFYKVFQVRTFEVLLSPVHKIE